MLKNFFRQLNVALLCGISVFIFFVLSFLWWVFDANTLVPIWILSLVIIACYLICVVIYGIYAAKQDISIYRLPTIRSIKQVNNKRVFIVEKNDLFNQGSYATVCYQDAEDSLEIMIGLGYVQSINSAGCLQIIIERLSDSDVAAEIYKEIEDTVFYRKAIKIKPSIDKKLLEEVITNG